MPKPAKPKKPPAVPTARTARPARAEPAKRAARAKTAVRSHNSSSSGDDDPERLSVGALAAQHTIQRMKTAYTQNGSALAHASQHPLRLTQGRQRTVESFDKLVRNQDFLQLIGINTEELQDIEARVDIESVHSMHRTGRITELERDFILHVKPEGVPVGARKRLQNRVSAHQKRQRTRFRADLQIMWIEQLISIVLMLCRENIELKRILREAITMLQSMDIQRADGGLSEPLEQLLRNAARTFAKSPPASDGHGPTEAVESQAPAKRPI